MRETKKMTSNNDHFWGHFDALRSTLIRMLATIGIAMLIAFCFHRPLVDFFISPLQPQTIKTETLSLIKVTNTGAQPATYRLPQAHRLVTLAPKESLTITQAHSPKLAIFSPAEGLTTILKVCFWVGLAVSSPLWFYWIYLFVAPALHNNEKRLFIPFTLLSFLFSGLGLTFCYFVTIPLANQYLTEWNAELGINLWGLSHYLNYTLVLLAANAVAFEACVILFFLIHQGKITADRMRRYRRAVVIAIFTLSALLTPPDVFTQIMMALPLIGFYELGVLYATVKGRSKKEARKRDEEYHLK